MCLSKIRGATCNVPGSFPVTLGLQLWVWATSPMYINHPRLQVTTRRAIFAVLGFNWLKIEVANLGLARGELVVCRLLMAIG